MFIVWTGQAGESAGPSAEKKKHKFAFFGIASYGPSIMGYTERILSKIFFENE
jgi:hypothetical protein